ncbi:MAG: type III pantothenate kinase [Candidatus Sumerlaeaceae bacterium]|jgi:type III pantothenate kinase
MILVVDIGNTNVVLGLFDGERLAVRWRVASDTRRTADEYSVLIEALLSRAKVTCTRLQSIVVGSVVPILSDTIDAALNRLCGATVFHVTYATPMPVVNKYAKPNEVGVDRLANAVAGMRIYGAPIIVVDVGTAVTLDVVSKDGEYLGGAILPGVELSAEALAKRTARLPRVAPHEPHHAIGRTTVESIRSGLLLGLTGAVDRLIEQMWDELGYQTRTVATGGLATSITTRSRIVKKCNEDLTLIGLKEIYLANQS